jgi:hypothetical protein
MQAGIVLGVFTVDAVAACILICVSVILRSFFCIFFNIVWIVFKYVLA